MNKAKLFHIYWKVIKLVDSLDCFGLQLGPWAGQQPITGLTQNRVTLHTHTHIHTYIHTVGSLE